MFDVRSSFLIESLEFLKYSFSPFCNFWWRLNWYSTCFQYLSEYLINCAWDFLFIIKLCSRVLVKAVSSSFPYPDLSGATVHHLLTPTFFIHRSVLELWTEAFQKYSQNISHPLHFGLKQDRFLPFQLREVWMFIPLDKEIAIRGDCS